jgi:hypothetical protein
MGTLQSAHTSSVQQCPLRDRCIGGSSIHLRRVPLPSIDSGAIDNEGLLVDGLVATHTDGRQLTWQIHHCASAGRIMRLRDPRNIDHMPRSHLQERGLSDDKETPFDRLEESADHSSLART